MGDIGQKIAAQLLLSTQLVDVRLDSACHGVKANCQSLQFISTLWGGDALGVVAAFHLLGSHRQ